MAKWTALDVFLRSGKYVLYYSAHRMQGQRLVDIVENLNDDIVESFVKQYYM